jgi:hypothetical protein
VFGRGEATGVGREDIPCVSCPIVRGTNIRVHVPLRVRQDIRVWIIGVCGWLDIIIVILPGEIEVIWKLVISIAIAITIFLVPRRITISRVVGLATPGKLLAHVA